MRRVVLTLLLATPLFAQAHERELRVVLPHSQGGIPVHLGDGWGYDTFHLYNDSDSPSEPVYRSVFQTSNKQSRLTASYILFLNDTAAPTAAGCRDSVMKPLIEGMSKQAKLKNIQQSTYTTTDGRQLLVASYLIAETQGMPVNEQNVFAFIGNDHLCAEFHISKDLYKPADDKPMNAELDLFRLDADYTPESSDYFFLATLLYDKEHAIAQAAVYYQPAFDLLPDTAPLTTRRVITDQLSMAYGISGDLKKSRAINEAAILKDPDYPFYYYNLACADAESGDATAAQTHLQQAYDRRANTLKGEHLPDPSKDDSFLKLKKDKAFWAFVQSLPKT